MAYAVCLFHVTWAMKFRQPTLTEAVESVVIEAINRKSAELDCPLFAINTCFDHIHVAVRIKPSISVADWVGKVKGYSSKSVHEMFPESDFAWQGGYGVLTFGQKQLPFVRDYIDRQKEHHQSMSLFPALEHFEE